MKYLENIKKAIPSRTYVKTLIGAGIMGYASMGTLEIIVNENDAEKAIFFGFCSLLSAGLTYVNHRQYRKELYNNVNELVENPPTINDSTK